MSDLYAWRFKGGKAIVVVRDVHGEPHVFQRFPGLPDFDLGELAPDSPLRTGPPTWNPLIELVPTNPRRNRR